MSENLERQLHLLKHHLLGLATLVEEAIAKACKALVDGDERLAREAVAADNEIDAAEVSVEDECISVLALYQPVARDLRLVVGTLKINSLLERMGDLAKKIAKNARYLRVARDFSPPVDFREMANLARDMVKRSLDALVESNTDLAREVRVMDDQIDDMRRRVDAKVRELIDAEPEQSGPLIRLFAVARHLERLADMATHVAEEVIYIVDGQIVRHQREPS